MMCLHTPGVESGFAGGRVVVFLTYIGGLSPTSELSLKFHNAKRNRKSMQVHLTRRFVLDSTSGVNDMLSLDAEVTVTTSGDPGFSCVKVTP